MNSLGWDIEKLRDDRSEDEAIFLGRLAAVRRGTAEQQAEFINSFRDYLRSVAINAIGDGANGKLSVSDLVQTTLIDACKGFELCRANGEDEFKAWLRKILSNDIGNRFRHFRRQKRDVGKEVDIDAAYAAVEDVGSPDFEAQRREDHEKLSQAIRRLTPEHQAAIRMRHHEKLTFAEIGQQTNRSADAARMLWNRAIAALTRHLGED